VQFPSRCGLRYNSKISQRCVPATVASAHGIGAREVTDPFDFSESSDDDGEIKKFRFLEA
jgi:hypothetical protein